MSKLLSKFLIKWLVALPRLDPPIAGKRELWVIISSRVMSLGSSNSRSILSFLFLAPLIISSLILIYSYNLFNCTSFNFNWRSVFYSFLVNSKFSTRIMFSLKIWLSISLPNSLIPPFFHSFGKFSLLFNSYPIF